MSLGLFYNAEIRNNGTGCLVWDAAKRGLGIPLTRYNRPGINVKEHAFNLMIDDGRDEIEWTPPKPNALWCIDTHLGYDARLRWAKNFDYVFTAQKDGAVQMKKDGIKKAQWLPLACHPPAHPNLQEMMGHKDREAHCGNMGLEKMFDLAFVGFMQDPPNEPGYNNRINYLDYMFKKFPNSWLSIQCFFEAMAVRYIRARLGFNISIRDDLNMRFFEIPSTGTAMLCNSDQVGYKELGFVDGEHFIGYHGPKEAALAARDFLKFDSGREDIAKAGHDLVRNKHTYAHRITELLEACGVDNGELFSDDSSNSDSGNSKEPEEGSFVDG